MGAILICNDDESMTCSLTGLLASGGHEVHATNRALDAVQKLLTGRFSTFILNLDIEQGKGAYLILVVNALDESIPVITLTREDSLELQRLARQGRVFFHAVWPEDRLAISSAVRNAEALRARRGAQGKNALEAISPCYLKRRITSYITEAESMGSTPARGEGGKLEFSPANK